MVRSSQHHFRTSRSIAISGSFFILRASTLRSGAIMVFPRDCFMGAIIWPLEAASSPKGALRFLPRCGSLNMRLNTLEQFRCRHVESSGYSLDCVQGNVSPAMLNLNDERLAQPNHEGKLVRRKARLLTQGLHSSAEFFLHWFAHGHKNMLSRSRTGILLYTDRDQERRNSTRGLWVLGGEMLMRDEETRALLRMFGENVRVSRESAGMSVEELAERMKQIDNETARESTRAYGRNIRIACEAAGLSVKELAKQVGISSIRMRFIERDAYRCNLSIGGKIASSLGVELASLFKRC